MLYAFGAMLHAHADDQITSDNSLQALAPGDIPDSGAFFKLSDYLANGGTLGAPWPFLMNTNAALYSLNGSSFLVDDAVITNDGDLANALILMTQPQDSFSTRMMAADSMGIGDFGDTNSSDGGGSYSSFTSVTYPTNALWIEVPTNSLAVNNGFSVILHNTEEDEPYDILGTTNLSLPLDQWTLEQSLLGAEGTNLTPALLFMNSRTNLFVTARFGGSSDGSGMPDWWELKFFGTNGVDPYGDPDGDGWNNLQEFQNGTDPNSFNTPPPPLNLVAHVDATGTNMTLTWASGGGPVVSYDVKDYEGDELAHVDSSTFSVTTALGSTVFQSWISNPECQVVANFSNGSHAASPFVSAYTPGFDCDPYYESDFVASYYNRNVSVFRDSSNQWYLGIQVAPPNLSGIVLYWTVENGFAEVSNILSATNLVNGIMRAPAGFGSDGQGDYVTIQLLGANGEVGEPEFFSPYFDYPPTEFTYATNIVLAAAQMKANLKFLLRSATVHHAFSYDSGLATGLSGSSGDGTNNPEQWFARGESPSDYEYSGFDVFSPGLGCSIGEKIRPVQENYLLRNFVFETADFDSGAYLNTGAGYDFDVEMRYFPNNPEFLYSGSSTETHPSIAFTNFTWTYHWPIVADPPPDWGIPTNDPILIADLGMYEDSDLYFHLPTATRNLYGLPVTALYYQTNSYLGEGFTILSPGGTSQSTLSDTSSTPCYMSVEDPDLQTVDYYFASQTPSFKYAANVSPPMPGSPTFAATNPSPVLITGVGQSFTVSGWAKQAILNGYTNKFAFLEQYFDFARAADSNGKATANGAGFLNPYGEFFPTNPGPAALITMPDIDTGQRGTGIVNVIKLQLDVNHDGIMDLSFGGPDNTSQARPFAFWVNNDYDIPGFGDLDSDAYAPNSPDYAYSDPLSGNGVPCIHSQRDLEDYARLWICGMPILTNAGYQVTLSWQNVSNNPVINLFQAVETNGGVGYLTNASVAALQTPAAIYIGSANGSGGYSVTGPGLSIGTVSLQTAFTFPAGYFSDGTTKFLLFEGAGIGSGQLTLTVSFGSNVLAQTSQWIDLHDVKDFFEQAYATNVTSGKPPSGLVSDFRILHKGNLPAQDEAKQIVVFIHGINNTEEDYETTSRTIFKRLYWANYHGRFSSFRWPCAYLPPTTANPFEYNLGEFYAFKSATALKNYLNNLKNYRADLSGYAIDLYAHSQGNVVTSEAILQGAPFDNYILTQGAFPAHCYDTNAPFLQKLLDAETNDLPTPFHSADGGYHGYCLPIEGNLINFYNTNDFALATGVTLGLPTNWEEDQRTQKPEAFIGGPSYLFDPITLITTGYYTFGSSYIVTDLQETKALVARSRSKAVGAQGGLHGSIVGEVDLATKFGFGNVRSEHSAQFSRPIQTVEPYWHEVVRVINPPTP
jgi:hypothetical protein